MDARKCNGSLHSLTPGTAVGRDHFKEREKYIASFQSLSQILFLFIKGKELWPHLFLDRAVLYGVWVKLCFIALWGSACFCSCAMQQDIKLILFSLVIELKATEMWIVHAQGKWEVRKWKHGCSLKFNLGFVSEAGAISDAFQPHLNMFPMKALIQVFPLTSFEIAVFYDSKSRATFLHGDPHSDRAERGAELWCQRLQRLSIPSLNINLHAGLYRKRILISALQRSVPFSL